MSDRKESTGPRESVAGGPRDSVAGDAKDSASAGAPEESAAGGPTESDTAKKEESETTNNNSNVNRNTNCSNDDDDDDAASRCFLAAWREVLKDLRAVLHAAPDLCSTAQLHDDELMTFPDESVDALAQSLVGDVYLSVSKCQSDPETVADHQSRFVTSLISALDVQPRHPKWTVRSIGTALILRPSYYGLWLPDINKD